MLDELLKELRLDADLLEEELLNPRDDDELLERELAEFLELVDSLMQVTSPQNSVSCGGVGSLAYLSVPPTPLSLNVVSG